MSMQVGSVNSVTFSRNAIKYLQGQKLEEESTGKQIIKSLPTSVAFASAFQIMPAISKARKFKGIDVSAEEFKNIWSGTVKNEGTLNAIKEFAEKNPNKFTSKLGKLFGKKSAEEATKKATEKAIGKATSNVAKTASKGFFGQAKSFFLFNMLFQLTDIIPAFKNGGAKEGVKQTVKSSAHAVGDAVAYTAGMKLGAAAGAKIGASIGTAGAGPIGTIVGGVLGMVLGGVASTLTGKLVKKVVGKSYNEKQAEEQAEAQVQQIANDQASVQELQTLVAQKIAEDQEDGKISDDTKEMINELNALQKNQTTSFGTLTSANNQDSKNAFKNSTVDDVNMGVRNNILNQQAQGIYEINNIPKNADGSIDHSIYQFKAA